MASIREIAGPTPQQGPLAHSERTDRVLFDATPNPIVLVTADGRVCDANPSALALYGYPRDEILGLHATRLLGDELDLGDLFASRPPSIPASIHRRRDGSTFLAESTLSFLELRQERLALAAVRDVSEERATLERLREAEERWRFALEGHGDGLWDWDLITGQIALSPQFKQILGYGPDELEHGFSWVELAHPDERRRTRELFDRHLAGHVPLLAVETRIRCKDGSHKWVALRGKIMDYGSSIRPARMIGTLRDIEAIKRREGKARNEQEQLAHAGRLITLGEMASALAHELNQPLTAIRNFSALGLRRLGSEAPAGVKGTLEIIAEQAMRAGEIVRRVRSFVRKGEQGFAPVQINDVATDMCRFAELDALAAGVEVVLELEPDLPPVNGDRSSLEQLVMNLIKNGIEAMQTTEGTRGLTISTALRPDDSIECSVTDQGTGVADKVRAGLFEPFVTTKPDGVGLGLTICRTIVENHGGRLWVEAAPGGGSTFRFVVPIVRKAQHV